MVTPCYHLKIHYDNIIVKQKALIMKRPKRICLILLMLMVFVFSVFHVKAEEAVNLEYSGHHGTHTGIPFVPMDMPDVYYDDVTQEIIIDGNGYSAYYDVEIVSESTLLTVLSANVDGDYDTIDISSLPDDNYTIVITSSEDNQYEGHFTN